MARGRRTPAGDVGPRVRDMRGPDLAQVVAIEAATAAVPWPRAMFAAEVSRPESIHLVSVEATHVQGYIFVTRYADVWHILNVTVRESARRRGIGRALMNEMFVRGDRHPHLGYTLEVRVSNAPAIRLYESLGFEDHGVRRGYYSDNGEDALVMWRGGEP
ncbi:MAG: ribosomal protein S18-alanine N-acetyltransferase [Miltoncostaeaceae bacterium]